MQIETCRKVENVLKRSDRKGSTVRVLPFHAALDQDVRLSNLKEFRDPKLKNGSLFLVCTDRYITTLYEHFQDLYCIFLLENSIENFLL